MDYRGVLSMLLGVVLAGLSLGCRAGPRVRLLTAGQSAGQIAADGRDVFFIAESNHIDGREVRAVPNRGGKVRTLYSAPKGRRIGAMVVDGGEVLIAEYTENHKRSAVLAVPAAGGKPRVIVEFDGLVGHLVADATHVFFVEGVGVYKAPRSGGDRESLFESKVDAEKAPRALAVAGKDLLIGTPSDLYLLPSKKAPARRVAQAKATCLLEYGGRAYWSWSTNELAAGRTELYHSVDLSGKDKREHPRGICPLVTRKGIMFVPDGMFVRTHSVGKEAETFADMEYMLRSEDNELLRWIAVDGKGLYASTVRGKILYTVIEWK